MTALLVFVGLGLLAYGGYSVAVLPRSRLGAATAAGPLDSGPPAS